MAEASVAINPFAFVVNVADFSYGRLAEDVLYNIFTVFKVQKKLIPENRCPEYEYRPVRDCDDTVSLIALQAKRYQIQFRHVFFGYFKKRNSANRIRNDIARLNPFITETLNAIRDTHPTERLSNPLRRFSLSIALVAELTLFLIARDKNHILKEIAGAWVNYFDDNLKKDFEARGGVQLVTHYAYIRDRMAKQISKFIPTRCVPYSGNEVEEEFLKRFSFDNDMVLELTFDSYDESEPETKETELEKKKRRKREKAQSKYETSHVLTVDESLERVPRVEGIQATIDANLLEAQKAAEMESDRAKARRALEVKAERRQRKKASIHQEKLPHPVLGASGGENIEESDEGTCDQVPSLEKALEEFSLDPELPPVSELPSIEVSVSKTKNKSKKRSKTSKKR